MNIRFMFFSSFIMLNTTLALAIQQEPLDALGHQAQLEMAFTALEAAPRPANVRQRIWEECIFSLHMDVHFLSFSRCDLTAAELSAIINSLPPILRAEINHFDISHNQLTQIPPAIGLLTSLTRLEAYNNELTDLPAIMSNLLHLRTLGINHNNFDHTPAVIAYLPALQFLDLSANRLSHISQLPQLHRIIVDAGVEVPEFVNPEIHIRYITGNE